ncbi:MAG: hypothetical protein J6W80_03220 [Kiritimatiellae bacterium]|nr:hypothetical protein [Kiritimatiellia bacterium]
MNGLLNKLRGRFGELWWWSAIIFVSCRFGDLINAFIGLWLVPKYVPQEELGAALPLLQLGSVFGLPLCLLVTPFSRWLTIYAANGENGKIKRLLSIVCYGAVAAFAIAVLVARFILPLFFERLRIAEGSLGFLLICAGLIGPVANVFNNALQGLKRFKAMSIINIFGAPVRLVTMLVAMPFRALSGYVLGQMSTPVLNSIAGWFSLRKELGKDIKSEPLGRDVWDMARYLVPFAAYTVIGTLLGSWQSLLFRQRLPEIESAAYYMITRISEIAAYAGISITFVVFPLAVEAREKGAGEAKLMRNMLLGTFLPGLLVTLALAVFGKWILGAVPLWRDYVPYALLLTVYALRMTIITCVGAFYSYETAGGRFGFLWYWLPLTLIETGTLIALTGYGAFRGILPDAAVDWMASLDAGRLSFFVWWLLACGVAQSLAIALHLALRRRTDG